MDFIVGWTVLFIIFHILTAIPRKQKGLWDTLSTNNNASPKKGYERIPLSQPHSIREKMEKNFSEYIKDSHNTVKLKKIEANKNKSELDDFFDGTLGPIIENSSKETGRDDVILSESRIDQVMRVNRYI